MSNGEQLIAEIPIEHLAMYQDYYRIGKILKLGGKCLCCLKGVAHLAIVECKAHPKGVRFVLYTEDWIELTVDHIQPKHKNGKDNISNYQVLCLFCNKTKGSEEISIEQLRDKIRRLTKEIISVNDNNTIDNNNR